MTSGRTSGRAIGGSARRLRAVAKEPRELQRNLHRVHLSAEAEAHRVERRGEHVEVGLQERMHDAAHGQLRVGGQSLCGVRARSCDLEASGRRASGAVYCREWAIGAHGERPTAQGA